MCDVIDCERAALAMQTDITSCYLVASSGAILLAAFLEEALYYEEIERYISL